MYSFTSSVASALARFGTAAIPFFVEIWKDPPENEGYFEITGICDLALSEIGTSAIPALIKLLEEDDNAMDYVPSALIHIGTRALPHLLTALENKNSRIRTGVACALGAFSEHADDFIDKLQSLAENDESHQVREQATRSLKHLQRHPGYKVEWYDNKVEQLFKNIIHDGLECKNCGLFSKDYKLSTGRKSMIICRKCGWVVPIEYRGEQKKL
jgi:hypothetical protein